jgi:hypothetical protein
MPRSVRIGAHAFYFLLLPVRTVNLAFWALWSIFVRIGTRLFDQKSPILVRIGIRDPLRMSGVLVQTLPTTLSTTPPSTTTINHHHHQPPPPPPSTTERLTATTTTIQPRSGTTTTTTRWTTTTTTTTRTMR